MSGEQNGRGAFRDGGSIAQIATRPALAGFLLVLLAVRLLFLLAALLQRVTRGLPDESRQLLREAGERARADIGERSPQAF